MQPIRIGILTVSDRASRGEYEDRGGPAIHDYMNEILDSSWTPVARIVSDDVQTIQDTLIELCDQEHCSLVVTTGGTGPAKRDVTPEATEAVCEKMMPGFGELMRIILSRWFGNGRRIKLDRQSARKTIGDCRVSGRRVPGDSLLC